MSPAARHLATVIHLDDRRPTVPVIQLPAAGRSGEEAPGRRALLERIAHSPAAADLRAHGWAVGLLLAALVLLITKGLA